MHLMDLLRLEGEVVVILIEREGKSFLKTLVAVDRWFGDGDRQNSRSKQFQWATDLTDEGLRPYKLLYVHRGAALRRILIEGSYISLINLAGG